MRLPNGSLRIWYASRKKPPFRNKYFAINTAIWSNPKPALPESRTDPIASVPTEPTAFRNWQAGTRKKLRKMLGIPQKRGPLNAEKRGQFEWDGIVVEKWVFTSEAGSRVPAVLYRPKNPPAKMPAIVLTYGHGGSKSQWYYNFSGQLYAHMGLAALAIDPMGEEERHKDGKLGTRAHDHKSVSDRADKAGRLIMGKMLFDTMRGIDVLMQRDDIDREKIGVAGNSLGGAKAGWMAVVDPRVKMSIVSGWTFQNINMRTKYCTSLPNQRMREMLTWPEYLALAAPDCAVKIVNGDADWVIDKEDDNSAWKGMDKSVTRAAGIYEQLGAPGKIETWYEAEGGHRPYIAYKEALEWIHKHLGTPAMTLEQIRALPTVNSGDFCDRNGIELESHYGTDLHSRGATLPDMGIRLIPREKLSCLKPGELGSDDFTIEGWLKQIETTEVSAEE
jgi:cephalosporin-C deacetylase-like acetyl esterase